MPGKRKTLAVDGGEGLINSPNNRSSASPSNITPNYLTPGHGLAQKLVEGGACRSPDDLLTPEPAW
jgi:hypothetical protein